MYMYIIKFIDAFPIRNRPGVRRRRAQLQERRSGWRRKTICANCCATFFCSASRLTGCRSQMPPLDFERSNAKFDASNANRLQTPNSRRWRGSFHRAAPATPFRFTVFLVSVVEEKLIGLSDRKSGTVSCSFMLRVRKTLLELFRGMFLPLECIFTQFFIQNSLLLTLTIFFFD